MSQPRLGHQGVALLNGSIMAIGGSTVPEEDGSWNESSLLTSCEMFVNGTWYPSSNLTHPRANFQVQTHEHSSSKNKPAYELQFELGMDQDLGWFYRGYLPSC